MKTSFSKQKCLKPFAWTEGSPIRRLGYARWLRNIAIGIGNSPYSEENISALKAKENFEDEAVKEHVKWALAEQALKQG